MASKLVFLAAAMTALVVMTHATFITTEGESEGAFDSPIGTEHCRREFRSRWPESCASYVIVLSSRIRHGYGEAEAGRSEYFERCCDELRRLEPECQCEAVQRMAKGMEMSLERTQGYQLMGKAMETPRQCGNMERRCRMISFMPHY